MITLKKSVIIQEAIESNEVSVDNYVDNPNLKTVTATILIGRNGVGDSVYKTYILWEGEEYDKIGQWTENDAEIRIQDIFNIYICF